MNNQVMIRQEGGLLQPQSMDALNMLVHTLAQANMLPKGHTPITALGAALYGMNAGLNAVQAMQSVSMINGRATIWGDAALALVRRTGLLESISETQEKDGKGGWVATCVVKRLGDMPHTMTFSTEEAKVAGVTLKGGPWQTYPRRMCQMRARSFALRDVFPDVLMGLQVADVNDREDVVEESIQSPVERFNNAIRVGNDAGKDAPIPQPDAVYGNAQEEKQPIPIAKTAEDVRQKWIAGWEKGMQTQDWDNQDYVDKMLKCATTLGRIDKTSEWSEKVQDMIAAHKAQSPETYVDQQQSDEDVF